MSKTALNEETVSSIAGGRPIADSAGSSRIAIYSQDGLGLGHLRRNIQICKEFLKQTPEGKGQVLLIADSPVAPFFQLPEGVDHIKLPSIRKLGAGPDVTYETFRDICETRPDEVVANIAVCLIHQTNYLLDRQIRRLEQDFVKEGGIRERMTRARLQHRNSGSLPKPDR